MYAEQPLREVALAPLNNLILEPVRAEASKSSPSQVQSSQTVMIQPLCVYLYKHSSTYCFGMRLLQVSHVCFSTREDILWAGESSCLALPAKHELG